MKIAFMTAGILALALGVIGIFLPLLPTVPFLLLAAFCFARGNPAWERRLLAHPRLGPPIRAWRERGAIGRRGKVAALATLVASAAFGWFALDHPWRLVAVAVVLACGTWIATRPER